MAQIDDLDDDAPDAAPPWRISRLGWMAYAIAAVVVALDQASKYWVLNVLHLDHQPPVQVLPFFQLTMVWNEGVSFGLLRHTPGWVLTLFAGAVVVVIAAFARRPGRPLFATALGLMMGGAIGNNLIDRLRFGAVADFLDFHRLWFPWVFNVADSAISVGVALFLLDSFLQPGKPPRG
ncbi:MAG: signal peptidase II [Caulobacteraceae bacterium]